LCVRNFVKLRSIWMHIYIYVITSEVNIKRLLLSGFYPSSSCVQMYICWVLPKSNFRRIKERYTVAKPEAMTKCVHKRESFVLDNILGPIWLKRRRIMLLYATAKARSIFLL
jgi:hypothetical protein